MSATMNAQKFQDFFNAPLFQVQNRAYPIEIYHLEEPTPNVELTVCHVVASIHNSAPKGDILVFQSGEWEVERVCDALRKEFEHQGL